MDGDTIDGLLNFSKVYMINSISKKIEDYLKMKMLEIKNDDEEEISLEWILQVADQNNFCDVVNMCAQYIGEKCSGEVRYDCSDIAQTKINAHYMIKLCKNLQKKASMVPQGYTLKNEIDNIKSIAEDMSQKNYLYC